MKIKNYNIPFLLLLLSVALLVACGGKTAPQAAQPQAPVVVPTFDADSAYHYTAGQVAFGPRVPNTEAHRQCGDWLESQLRRFGAQVTAQHVTLRAYDGTVLAARNIIGSYKPETRKRVLLCAHWDSRPWADADLYFIEEIGLKEHLSPTRSNGLVAMVKQMRLYALAYKARHAQE